MEIQFVPQDSVCTGKSLHRKRVISSALYRTNLLDYGCVTLPERVMTEKAILAVFLSTHLPSGDSASLAVVPWSSNISNIWVSVSSISCVALGSSDFSRLNVIWTHPLNKRGFCICAVTISLSILIKDC